ncbi:nuclear transcription factor Y subunit A-1-like [Cucurbita pepo subsp. pepo]|uniref:nuclear transcription factor Y subunit A-1-like n=1 Tax=Cucurbita pepo subsp. pepo TaxID=3664 RepID=UPI000C9D4CB1|nr:nuclear transcription factor Y subunit A-1-like [Cucurbita pepo subsp. pepo]XP_023533873.1 nuclear transcription factor Y subunit A-1-like [Cucurbita pepo subsp. pepo]
MQFKSKSVNQVESEPPNMQQTGSYSEPWWRSIGYNPISPSATGGNVSNSPSLECTNGASESNDGQSMSNADLNEDDDDDDTTKETQAASYGQGQHNNQHAVSTAPRVHGGCITQPPQLELVGHSIACASNQYQDPYYAGLMAAYGHQPMGYPPFIGMPHARMALPLEVAQEPVFVNAKQYQGILRRRQARAKAEVENKLIKVRKPYLHESRHQHAMRRARGTGGRFAKKNEAKSLSSTMKSKESGSGQAISSSSSGSEAVPGALAETWNSSNSQQEARAQLHESYEARSYVNGNSHFHNYSSFQASSYALLSGERGEDGDCSGQQRGSISENQAAQRRLAIK